MTSRISLARTGFASIVAILVLAVVGTSCASGGAAAGTSGGGSATSSKFAYGYMIPGARVSAMLNVAATDTVAELQSRSSLPSTLTNAISTEATASKWNNSCTRRFGGPTNFAVIFFRQCSASAGAEADPVVIIGFSAEGKQLAKVSWTGENTVTLLFPSRRF